MALANGLMVVSPPNISLAARAVLINAAKNGSMTGALINALMVEQQEYSEESGFWPMPSLRLSPPNQHRMRTCVCGYAPGRFLQVIQIPVNFDGFPERGFASLRALGPEPSQFVADQIAGFWRFLRKQADWRQGVSVLLLSGWGTPHSISPPIDASNVPANWIFLPISFSDAAVLGACDDGRFRDVVRILQQVERLEGDGFSFQNLSGIVNLFGYWRTTGGNLIPEHLTEIVPPCNVMLPTDELLAPRIEAAKKRDMRALPLPGGGYKVVQRLDWSDIDDLKPVYASPHDATEGRLVGAAVFGAHVWWVECTAESDEDREWQFRIWHALFQWLAMVGQTIIADAPAAFPDGSRAVNVVVPPGRAFARMDAALLGAAAPSAALRQVPADGDGPARLEIDESWLPHLGRRENDAEVELIAALLELFCIPGSITREALAALIRSAIRSTDWRWFHAREAFTVIDRMAGHGLTGSFKKLRLSAHALAKCRSIWAFRDRAEGLEIEGEENCKAFLAKYRESLFSMLIDQIRRIDRAKLMVLCAEHYQAARAEQMQWRFTIRAMRAIHGDSVNTVAFKQQNAINAIQRASKSICEVAACEAAESGGLEPSHFDLEEIFALALLLIGNGQLVASISAGIIEAKLKISPAGDLLSNRSVHDTMLRPSAEWSNRRVLDEAAQAYLRNQMRPRDESTADRMPLDAELRRAIEAEYNTSAEAFIDLQYAIVQMAEARSVGVFTMRRTELAAALVANNRYPCDDPVPFLTRLTLPRRASWRDRSTGLTEPDIDLSRLDRPYSIINRPLVAMDDDADPLLLVAPIFVSDACMYSFAGLMSGSLNNTYWTSGTARAHAGAQGKASGEKFEDSVAARLRGLGLQAWPRCKLSWALNAKVDPELGDIDVLAVSLDGRRVWLVEAKNLRLCRNELEIASRLSEYRGRMVRNSKGREVPDKMLRHIRRVQYLRDRRESLCARLDLNAPPEVRGLLVVDVPQPMNFFALGQLPDGETTLLDAIDTFSF